MPAVKCDIIVAGGGLAGLSLLYRAMKAGIWKTEQIIVIDRSGKQENDKTWSFWKTEDSAFEEIIHHRWENLVFFSNEGQKILLKSGVYTYNSIRSLDFYNHVLSYLKTFSNISFVREDILTMTSSSGKCELVTPSHTYNATYLFNSVYNKPVLCKMDRYSETVDCVRFTLR